MFTSCLEKQSKIKEILQACDSEEARFEKIIELGKELPKLDKNKKTEQALVRGCQSQMYLHAELIDHQMNFQAEADALISAGLAALLIRAYNGETPEVVLKCPPSFIEELGINASLTPSRSNGLYSLHLQMKQEALRLLMEKEKT